MPTFGGMIVKFDTCPSNQNSAGYPQALRTLYSNQLPRDAGNDDQIFEDGLGQTILRHKHALGVSESANSDRPQMFFSGPYCVLAKLEKMLVCDSQQTIRPKPTIA